MMLALAACKQHIHHMALAFLAFESDMELRRHQLVELVQLAGNLVAVDELERLFLLIRNFETFQIQFREE